MPAHLSTLIVQPCLAQTCQAFSNVPDMNEYIDWSETLFLGAEILQRGMKTHSKKKEIGALKYNKI